MSMACYFNLVQLSTIVIIDFHSSFSWGEIKKNPSSLLMHKSTTGLALSLFTEQSQSEKTDHQKLSTTFFNVGLIT